MCDFKGCKEIGESACIIISPAGDDYQRIFCSKCLKKMLWDEKDVCYESNY